MPAKKNLRNVWWLGIVSLLTDVSSEMLFPIIPLFLTLVLKVNMILVGVIEGVAVLVMAFARPLAGWVSDKFRERKKIVLTGYGLSSASKFILLFSTSWVGVLFFKLFDRLGKGMRTDPRDALIVDSVSTKKRGRYFGLHRALDTSGAVLGVLILLILLYFLGSEAETYKIIFAVALVPAVLAVLVLGLFVRNVEKPKKKMARVPWKFPTFSRELKWYFVIIGVFGLAQLSVPFFLIRTKEAGFSVLMVPVFYLLMNVFYAGVSFPAGVFADKKGKSRVLFASFLVFILVALGFGFLPFGRNSLWFFFPLYGIFFGMFDSVSRVMISDFAKQEQVASALGVAGMIEALALFTGNAIAGLLWTTLSASYAFLWACALTAVTCTLMLLFMNRRKIKPKKYRRGAEHFRFYRV